MLDKLNRVSLESFISPGNNKDSNLMTNDYKEGIKKLLMKIENRSTD